MVGKRAGRENWKGEEKEGENTEDEKGEKTQQRKEIPTGQVSLRLKF